MAKKEKKGIFRRLIDAIKRIFGLKTEDEKLAEEQNSDGDSRLRKLEEENGIMIAPDTETKKSGSSPMVVVPSSDAAKKTTETTEPAKTEEIAEEETEKSK